MTFLEQEKALLCEFGSLIRLLRKEKGLSQEDLAFKCGLDRTYIGGVERGERNVGLINIIRIANALDLDILGLKLCHS